MNGTLPEMLHCLQTPGNLAGNGADMTVLERQRARLKWSHEQQQPQELSQQSYFGDNHFNLFPLPSNFDQGCFLNNESMIRELSNRSMKNDPGLENGWPDFGKYSSSSSVPRPGFGGGETVGFVSTGFVTNNSVQMNDFCLSRTASCPPQVGNVIPAVGVSVVEEKTREMMMSSTEKMASTVGRESFKKRKADKAAQNPKVGVTEDSREKKIKGGDAEEVESKITEQRNNNNRETSADTSKDNSKISEVQKPDYIHVRARRGQATDSHSLAERVRREKISERMKYLQDLVPGCNKITGKAGMLDEIINYVQSLQRQVEFLSMKLATVNPRLDSNVENFLVKDMFSACTGGFPIIETSTEMTNCSPYLQFNPVQQMVSSCGLDMVINPSELAALRRTTSAPVTFPETFLDTSCFTQEQPSSSAWETDLQNLYSMEFHQGRPTEFPSQSFTGTMEANNLKMEM